MTDMKTALFIVFALIAPVVLGMEIPALPPPEYADTEVSTNFVFAVGEGRVCNVKLRMESVELWKIPYLRWRTGNSTTLHSQLYILNSSCSRHIDPAWNLVKVTRRGLGASNENVSFKFVEFGFGVKIW